MGLFAKKPLPEWDGNSESLPEKGRKFVYKERVYVWRNCECGCGRPEVYFKGKADPEMTIRMRGKNQNDPLTAVIAKFGHLEKLIAAKDRHDITDLFNSILDEATQALLKGKQEYLSLLETKGINQYEMEAAMRQMKRIVNRIFICDLLAS